jgi:exopolysaccharide biosynthesis polyprenyl glycosylphosphotransferase
MFRRFSANFAVFSIFIDMALVDVALLVSALLRVPIGKLLPQLKEVGSVSIPWILYMVFPVLWVGVLLLFSVYDGRKKFRVVDELSSLTLGSLLAFVSLAGVLYLSYREISRFLFLMAAGSSLWLMVAWRLVFRFATHNQGLHPRLRRVLIVGAGEIGQKVAAAIEEEPYQGLVAVGFLDDEEKKSFRNLESFGGVDCARQVVLERSIDDIVIAMPMDAHERVSQLVSAIHDLPVRVWVIPDYFALTLHRAEVSEMAGIPMLDLRAPTLSEYQLMLKRAFDILITLLILPFVLPVMGLVGLAILLDSPGPVFYLTGRAGENGRVFRMIKFRTMIVGADRMLHQVARYDANGAMIHKIPNDPRVTRVGRFLRRTSLDELPQLFNVLLGDMSLVGPRPEMPELVEKYDLWQRKRFTVPQGMTGWWQINGRSDKPMHLHTEEDLYYVQHYSIWLDLKILMKTAWVVLCRKGAF